MFDTIPYIYSSFDSTYVLRSSIDESATKDIGLHLEPFNYLPTSESNLYFDVSAPVADGSFNTLVDGIAGVPILFSTNIQNLMFILFACCFVLLSIITRQEGSMFLLNFKNVLSLRSQRRSAFKDQITIAGVWVGVFLVFQTILLLSIGAASLLWTNRYAISILFSDIHQLLIALFVGIFLFVISKYILYRSINYIFPDWGLKSWTSQFFTVIGMMGLLIFFPTLLLVFSPELSEISIWLIVGILGAILFFFYRNLLIVFVKNNIGLLNYFLYLCAIEIVPLFLIYKGGIILANIAGKY